MSVLSEGSRLTLDEPMLPLNPLLPTHAEGQLLRRYGPLVPVSLQDDVRVWATTTHEASRIVLEHHPHLAKNSAHWGALRRGEIPAGWPLLPFVVGESMLFADGADHRRLRRAVVPAFTARRVAALTPRIEQLTRELLDEIAVLAEAAPDGVVDLKERFAHPLALRIICELFGISDAEQQNSLRDHYAGMLSLAGPDTERQAAAEGLIADLARLVEAKRAVPGDDLTSDLAAVREEGTDRLTEKELLDTLQIVLIAGHETVLNALTNTVHALLTHPDQLALVRDGVHEWSAALEAGLSWDGPQRNLYMRFALQDTEILGIPIREGEPIIVLLAASDRDGGFQSGPTRYDVTRSHKGHLAFGAGPHLCVGAPLARLEGTVALRELFTRYPDLNLAVPAQELEFLVSPAINGVTALPVRLR
ncbi:cytochrome P450 [Streptomyces sp. J2-1]|uniref:cytochrome P450 family protein n=1 Tax=Streptomyces corallincola TaxID=2851888 RepID=UPI001C39363E|nr:cytochrome P450 [Streptomyces corallincola]MBV2354870.1 cytochrome P450 [Streptomyces corallincola]